MQHLRISVQSGVDEADCALASRNARLVDSRQNSSEGGRRRAGPTDEKRLAVSDDDDVVADGREVRVATPAAVVDAVACDVGTGVVGA